MIPRRIIDTGTTPEGKPFELAHERGHYVLRVGGVVLMSSATRGSEMAMARAAATRLEGRSAPRVLVGGLGMGFTLRAALDAFEPAARITVAELLPQVVGYARGELAPLSNHAIDDPRVRTHIGDVRTPLAEGAWDAVLLDVDNGPDALTVASNAGLYGHAGCRSLATALTVGGVVVVWSGYEDAAFAGRLRHAGLECVVERVRAREGSGSEGGSGSGSARKKSKGAKHTLFIGVRRA